MPDVMAPGSTDMKPMSPTSQSDPLRVGWQDGLSIVNLRGDPQDAAFRDAVSRALGVALPDDHLRTASGPAGPASAGAGVTIVPAGPDDWFVISLGGGTDAVMHALRDALAGRHVAITDVSSGYVVLRLAGAPARDVLAQGCPLDLHPRAFGPGQCAGSHFFKTSVWLWRTEEESSFELLVRRSFVGYVRLMLEQAALECGLMEEPARNPGRT